nr:type IV pilin-like G/H family protein [Oscillatoria sp. FACHB-1406]
MKVFVCRLAAVGMVAGLSGIVLPSANLPAVAQSSPSVQPQATSPLHGEWRFNGPTPEESISLLFSPDDKLYFILPDGEGSQIAIQMKYSAQFDTQPSSLDVMASAEDKALTVFELTPDGKLRIDLDVSPGDSRPEKVGENAIAFERVSNATRPPTDLQVIDLTAAPAKTDVPVQFISIILSGQSDFYRKNGKFAASVEELGLATDLETEEYRYQLQPERDSSNNTIVTATPKVEGLPSYAGAIFTSEDKGTSTGGICRSDLPSTTPPLPLSLNRETETLECPSGSSLLK